MINPNSNLNKLFSASKQPILFIDFDGTISRRDVIDAVLEEFADKLWLTVEDEWLTGKIGSRECLQRQFALVRATPDELNEFLDSLELDEGLTALLDFCHAADVRAHVVSDGFAYYIKRHLERHLRPFPHLLKNIGVWANNLISDGENQWSTEFPYFPQICANGCATCKPAVMKLTNELAAPSIFIGDGLSDRFAAGFSDAIFAKKKLASFCLEQGIEFTAYENLGQIARCLNEACEKSENAFYKSSVVIKSQLLKAA